MISDLSTNEGIKEGTLNAGRWNIPDRCCNRAAQGRLAHSFDWIQALCESSISCLAEIYTADTYAVENDTAVAVEAHPGAVAAVAGAVKRARKCLGALAERLAAAPDPLVAGLVVAHVQVLIVGTAPEERLHAGFGAEKPRLSVGVSEGVNLPSATRHLIGAEVLFDELVATGGLVNHGNPERGCLVVHAPGAVDELQAALGDKGARVIPAALGLLLPPTSEEANFHICSSKGIRTAKIAVLRWTHT